ncbi:MAG: DNA helicase RecQ [Rhizobiaceae bacterium]
MSALASAPIEQSQHPVDALDQAKWGVLKDVFGYDRFRPGQEEIIDCLLNGTSVLAIMPTGAGKSLCFQVPALALPGLTIVVSPLVALMQDQVAALQLAGVAAEAINSTQDRDTNVAVWQKVARGETKILYMAPERLMTERMLQAISRLTVSLIAVDEAHCMSQWGPAFRPEYAELGHLSQRFPNVPIAAMTATADEATRRDIELSLFAGKFQTFMSGFDRPNIALNVAPKASWKQQMLDYVGNRKGQSGIIYCLSRKKTEECADALRANGINAVAYHAGLEREERQTRQNRFVTEDDLVVAATIAFGMGIDKPDVRFVFHTDLPGSVEAYYQEIGRAGRDGAPADAMMVFGAGDIRLRRQFIEQADSDEDHKRREVSRLNSLVAYAEAQGCRRQTLLAYFGDKTEPCGNCDNCLNPVEMLDGGRDAELVFGAIFETGQRFGQAHIVDVLRGAETEKVIKMRHDKLECHGSGARHAKAEWQAIVRQMIAGGFLEVDIAGYSSLLITDKGNALSRGQGEFKYRADTLHPLKKKSFRGGGGVTGGGGSAFGKSQPAVDLSSRDQELLGQLKTKRLALAKERGVPAYVIFPDKTLIDMAAKRPTSMEEFAEVRGVGKSKLDQFGAIFIEVVQDAP